ncbi:hypothetical protein [Paenibacillus sp. FSL H8-0034]|uniref:hypothetical protein n=1 Tax=Paenibacillus sp. FSL H8-0034 TaxID=2954671 RepID=UPI0030F7D5EC
MDFPMLIACKTAFILSTLDLPCSTIVVLSGFQQILSNEVISTEAAFLNKALSKVGILWASVHAITPFTFDFYFCDIYLN